MRIIDIAAAAASAAVAGVYVNFSARVMPRLAGWPAADAVATMQRFNRIAVRAPFMTAFFGGAALSAYQVLRAVSGETAAGEQLAAGAGLAHLAGFALTIAYNVPRNERLARLAAGTPPADAYWAVYLREWTGANTVRAVLSLVALALGIAAAGTPS